MSSVLGEGFHPDLSDYVWQPRHNKLLAWNMDPAICWSSTGFALSAGVGHYFKVMVPETMTFSAVACFIEQAGSGAQLPVNCFSDLYNSAGTRIGTSAAQDTPWQTVGYKTAALTVVGGQSLTVTGGRGVFVLVGLLIGTQSTTTVTHVRNRGSVTGLETAGVAATDVYRAGSQGSGLTTLPATMTPTTLAAINSAYIWVALL